MDVHDGRWDCIPAGGRRRLLVATGLVLASMALLAAACSGSSTQVRYYQGGGGSTTVFLSILSPAQTARGGYPAYVPAYFTVPAHSKVTFVITNFDDATPLQSPTWSKVMGTVGGTMTVEPIAVTNPAKAGKATTVSKWNPDDVSHTFTVPTLGNLNVPIPGDSRVTFTVETGNAGKLNWFCMDPCGCAPNGLGCSMATPGYMLGTITVV